MALTALIIRERLNCTEDELVEQNREYPYLHFFLGLETFTHAYPFDASMMVHFRKRITMEMVCEINEALIAKLRSSETPFSDEDTPESGSSITSSETPPPLEKNQSKLILDSSCAPTDITYPTDTNLLNAAREKSEELIDVLHAKRPPGSPKPMNPANSSLKQKPIANATAIIPNPCTAIRFTVPKPTALGVKPREYD